MHLYFESVLRLKDNTRLWKKLKNWFFYFCYMPISSRVPVKGNPHQFHLEVTLRGWQDIKIQEPSNMPLMSIPIYFMGSGTLVVFMGSGTLVVFMGSGTLVVFMGSGTLVVFMGSGTLVVFMGSGTLVVFMGSGTLVVFMYLYLPCRSDYLFACNSGLCCHVLCCMCSV